MKKEMKQAIKTLAINAENAAKSEDSQRLAQAALNLAQAIAVLGNEKRQPKQS